MGKGLGAAAVAALVAVGGLSAGSASADDMKMGPGATCSPAGTSLTLTAQDHKFDKDCLAVPVGQPFTIRFDNKDTDRHNVAILPSHMATTTFFQGDIILGPKSVTYSVAALKPGTWHFHCEIHPNLMNGTFIVGDAKSAPAPMPAAPAPAPPPMAMDKPATPPAAGTAPATAAPMPKTAASATPAPAPAPAPKADMPGVPAPRQAAGAAAPKAAAAPTPAGTPLPRTGPQSDRLLLLTAGLALAAGGLSVLAGARRAATGG